MSYLINSYRFADPRWWLGGGAVPESTAYTVYDPAVASSESASFVNLVNPGVRDAVKSGTVTFLSGVGWQGDGATGYLDTGTVITQNTTIIVFYREAQSGRYLFGALQASPNRTLSVVPQSSTNVAWDVGSTFTSSATRHLGGTIAANMVSGFRNGVRDTSVSFTASFSATSRTIKLLAYDNGTISLWNSAIIHRVAIYDFRLSDAQIKAVHDEMIKVGESSLHPYSSAVLALNPSAYYPMNVKSGFMFSQDKTSNNVVSGYIGATGTIEGGATGQYGNAIQWPLVLNTRQITPFIGTNYNNLNSFDLDECSISAWINITYAGFNQKVLEIWRTGLAEYIAYEIRATNKFGFFTRANGVDQNNSSVFTGLSGWNHIVMYNSVSQGKVGFYYNGVNYETAKTLGATVTRTNGLIEIGAIAGAMQHVAFYPYLLNQTQVNSLL